MNRPKMIAKECITTINGAGDFSPFKKVMGQKGCFGAIKFIIRDRAGQVLQVIEEPNIVKIFAKEMLAHRLPSSEIWNPNLGSSGDWTPSGIDVTEEFSARYILFGAAFDTNGSPVVNDPRYYTFDSVTGSYVPIQLEPGADYGGSLINAIPLTEPNNPLKRVESITFDPTYQPAGIPLLQPDVRAINNIVQLQTTLELDEYNGFGSSASDYFIITEVALAGGYKLNSTNDCCGCTPDQLFLQGSVGPSGTGSGASYGSLGELPIQCIANGSDTISINPSEIDVNTIVQGDQIKIVGPNDSRSEESINQVSPFYLVVNKAVGGRDITLDRTPVDVNNNPIASPTPIGVYRDTLRLFSHRILVTPFQKSNAFQIDCIWSIIFN